MPAHPHLGLKYSENETFIYEELEDTTRNLLIYDDFVMMFYGNVINMHDL
jgi:hypothetical protein